MKPVLVAKPRRSVRWLGMSTRHTGRRRAASLLIAAVLLLSGGAVLAAGHVAIARPVLNDTSSSLVETAVPNYHFEQPEFAQLPTNTTINVTFYNNDPALPHTFTILDRSDWQIPNQWTNLSELMNQHGTLVNLSAGSGNTTTGSFLAPGPGWYEFLCLVSGHFGLGMYGFIAFGEDLPSNLSIGTGNPGPGLAVFIIVGTIVALTVLALILGFVFGRREGSVHEMPAERLGYPEPPRPPAAEPPRPDS